MLSRSVLLPQPGGGWDCKCKLLDWLTDKHPQDFMTSFLPQKKLSAFAKLFILLIFSFWVGFPRISQTNILSFLKQI